MRAEIAEAAAKLGVELNSGQLRAIGEILDALDRRRTHLLAGFAGVGKTVVMQVVAIILRARKRDVVLSAPTHQAVAVLGKKMRAASIEIPCMTLARLKVRRTRRCFWRRALSRDDRESVLDAIRIDDIRIGS